MASLLEYGAALEWSQATLSNLDNQSPDLLEFFLGEGAHVETQLNIKRHRLEEKSQILESTVQAAVMKKTITLYSL